MVAAIPLPRRVARGSVTPVCYIYKQLIMHFGGFMKAPSITSRILLVLLATVLLVLSATLAWAAVSDYQDRGIIPDGVTVAGTSLAGMTEQQAREAIKTAVDAPLSRPLTAQVETATYELDPKGIVSVDADKMIADAYAPRRTATLIQRVGAEVTSNNPAVEVAPAYTIDSEAVGSWIAGVAATTDKKAINADVGIEDGAIVTTESVPGKKLDVAGAAEVIGDAFSAEQALAGGDAPRTITLKVKTIKPKITEQNFGKYIVVRLNQRKIWLYDDFELEKTYGIAVGQPRFPTPQGEWKIVAKRYMPTWRNPHNDAWSNSMPESIPPGRNNPLGTRALNLDASGIRFHGTTADGSIGTAASHGCMRMHMWDVEDLYPRVPMNTPVLVVP